jgi:uncharacterized protein YbcV (DUF1398 family)
MSFIDKISQAEKVGQIQYQEYALKSASLDESMVKSLVHVPLIQCLIDKISQAEKVGQMQHPEYALKSASLDESMV